MQEDFNYEILIGNELDENWATCFSPFSISIIEHNSLLSGKVHDQAELFGVLLKIRDLGLTLISVNREIFIS